MLNNRRVFILGSSLLTNGIVRMLEEDPRFMVLGCVTTVDEALAAMATCEVDAIVVMGTDHQSAIHAYPVLARYPDVPFLHADISQDHVQLVTSQKIKATPSELLAAIANLPRRNV